MPNRQKWKRSSYLQILVQTNSCFIFIEWQVKYSNNRTMHNGPTLLPSYSGQLPNTLYLDRFLTLLLFYDQAKQTGYIRLFQQYSNLKLFFATVLSYFLFVNLSSQSSRIYYIIHHACYNIRESSATCCIIHYACYNIRESSRACYIMYHACYNIQESSHACCIIHTLFYITLGKQMSKCALFLQNKLCCHSFYKEVPCVSQLEI